MRKKYLALFKKQKREIQKIYSDICNWLKRRLKRYNEDTLTEKDLLDIKKELEKEFRGSAIKIASIIDNNLNVVSNMSYSINTDFFKSIDKKYGTNLLSSYKKAVEGVNDKVKDKIKNGEVYKSDFKLSEKIWGSNKKTIEDINKIIDIGIKEKKNPYTIAKDLEKYVNPSVKKDYKWANKYPGSNKVVDYNAQRLATTSITHAHQISMMEYAKSNRFITYLQYNASGDKACDLCMGRDGELYLKDEVPLDHPNGRCFMTLHIPDNFEDLILDYINSDDFYFDLDE